MTDDPYNVDFNVDVDVHGDVDGEGGTFSLRLARPWWDVGGGTRKMRKGNQGWSRMRTCLLPM